MNHLPSIQTLRAFAAAYRLQNYSHAGVELGLTHGAISHRVRELETRVGAPLFARRGARMEPTIAARQLIARIGPALRSLEETFETASKGHPRQPLRVSVLPGFAARWLVSRLEDFHTRHQRIKLAVTTDVQLVEVGGRSFDAAIRYGLGAWPGLESEKLANEVLFPVCSPSYRSQTPISQPADLLKCSLLHHTWQAWTTWFEAAGVEVHEGLEGPVYAESDLLLKAAESGQGIALGRRLLAHDELQSGRLVRLFDIEASDNYAYYLVRPKVSRRADEIDALASWLKERIAASLD